MRKWITIIEFFTIKMRCLHHWIDKSVFFYIKYESITNSINQNQQAITKQNGNYEMKRVIYEKIKKTTKLQKIDSEKKKKRKQSMKKRKSKTKISTSKLKKEFLLYKEKRFRCFDGIS
ncbi:mitochondrial coenzyme A transporter [Sarcoptes scabiei]|nr:mitochondrial coenzyme A transporter [Sarcoptes scabiei]